MKITKSYKGLTESPCFYRFYGHLLSDDDLDIYLNKPLIVEGNIYAKHGIFSKNSIESYGSIDSGGCIQSKYGYVEGKESITAELGIKTGSGIFSYGSIRSGGNIKAKTTIKSGENIEADGCIEAKKYVTAIGSIVSGKHIKSGSSIAGIRIMAKNYISARESIYACYKIECSKIIRGEIEHGDLILINAK